LPAAIGAIAYQNKAVIYDLLFHASLDTMLTIAADPKHLGAKIGVTAVLHTWGSAMTWRLSNAGPPAMVRVANFVRGLASETRHNSRTRRCLTISKDVLLELRLGPRVAARGLTDPRTVTSAPPMGGNAVVKVEF